LNNLRIHQFTHLCVVIDYVLKKIVKKYKTTIEKYCFDIPIDEIKPLLCKRCYSFFQKNKTPKLLVPTNIILNDPIDSVKKLNELKE
jgi:RNase P subunit RPR2